MSEAYSNPTFNISTLVILFAVEDSGNNLALIPWVEATLTNLGVALYPNPPDTNWISFIEPTSFFDVVEYSNLFVLLVSYFKISGLSANLISNVVSPTPATE